MGKQLKLVYSLKNKIIPADDDRNFFSDLAELAL